MTNELDVDALLRSTGAVLTGHFRLTSGRHSDTYVEKFRIMENPAATATLCAMIGDHYRDAGVTTVAGPAMGGVILAYETARHMGVRNIFAEKDASGQLYFDRGFAVEPGEPVLVIDDVLTTGGSMKRLIELLQNAGANIVGVAFLIDRTNGAVDFGLPFYACHVMNIESYAPDECALCKQGIELIET
jgi:orotate phosphoribosyltransferase